MPRTTAHLRWQQSLPADQGKPAHLLTFATELRTMIFQRTLPSNLVLRVPRYVSVRRLAPTDAEFAEFDILLSCYQMYVEGSGIFYSRNTFAIEALRHEWFPSTYIGRNPAIPASFASFIRHVPVSAFTSSFNTSFLLHNICLMLKSWPNVVQLTVMVGRDFLGDLQLKIDALGDRELAVQKATTMMVSIFTLNGVKVPKAMHISMVRMPEDADVGFHPAFSLAWQRGATVNVPELEAMVNEAWQTARSTKKRILSF